MYVLRESTRNPEREFHPTHIYYKNNYEDEYTKFHSQIFKEYTDRANRPSLRGKRLVQVKRDKACTENREQRIPFAAHKAKERFGFVHVSAKQVDTQASVSSVVKENNTITVCPKYDVCILL